MKVGRITLSDRASQGIYEDRSGPEIERVFRSHFEGEIEFVSKLLPDDLQRIVSTLREFATIEACQLIITTGGTGPSVRDITPEATREVIEKELPGFGEIMRAKTYDRVPTSILSRATAGIYKKSLIINLPGNPKSIGECLPVIHPAIVECLKHIA